MSGLIDKRKRSREEESCDSAHPLSKRINNLHLNNDSSSSPTLAQYSSNNNNNNNNNHDNISEQHQLLAKELNGFSKTTPLELGVDAVAAQEQHMHLYNPELGEAQNPFYYDKNKLLHALHLERLKRFTV